MKIGSIVVVMPYTLKQECIPFIKWKPVGDKTTPYMIRSLDNDEEGTTLAHLEEGVMGFTPDGEEFGIPLRLLREILPPEKVELENFICEPVNNTYG